MESRPLEARGDFSAFGGAADEAFSDTGAEADMRKHALQRGAKTFDRITLWGPDGTQVTIEADGEVWRIEGSRRTLARTLSAAQMETLRRQLASVEPSGWSGGDSSPRLVVEAGAVKWIAALPTGNAAIDTLVRLLERWGS